MAVQLDVGHEHMFASAGDGCPLTPTPTRCHVGRMRGLARAVALSLLAALLLAPTALAQQPPARKSDNVKWLESIAEPQVVSARFKGTKMFVSTLKGLAVYEVANPANPQRIGFLPLPHFENEDVDMSVGGNFVLISNDPSEGKGVLYVVDVSNPASPSIKGVMETGIADLGFDPGFGPPLVRHRPHRQLRPGLQVRLPRRHPPRDRHRGPDQPGGAQVRHAAQPAGARGERRAGHPRRAVRPRRPRADRRRRRHHDLQRDRPARAAAGRAHRRQGPERLRRRTSAPTAPRSTT